MENEELISEEFNEFTPLATLEEDIKDGKRTIYLKSILAESDVVNGNRRVYPKKVLKEAYDELMARCNKQGQMPFGELEHAQTAKVNLERIACVFPELIWEEDTGRIVGKAKFADTEAGRTAEGLAKSGFRLGFSTRAAGKVKPYHGPLTEDQNVVEVMPGLKIVSIDIVGTPSAPNAVSSVYYEGKDETLGKKTIKGKDLLDLLF